MRTDEMLKVQGIHDELMAEIDRLRGSEHQATEQRDLVMRENERLRADVAELENDIAEWEKITDVVTELRADNAALLGTLCFFSSVIKSGESWSTTCQRAYDDAIARAEGRT